jgi:hypothetical protein
MIGDSKDFLYELLPMFYRRRDAEQGWPLRAFLQVITEQVDVVKKDIDQLYENWFIETCQDWVVPYIGDLIGYEPVHDAGEPGDVRTEQGQKRNKILIPRAEVANTIRNRRRKGTLALLELLALDVAGWPARAVEFYTLLSYTQSLNHIRLDRGRTVDLRNTDALTRIGGPFDEVAHTIDVRRPNSYRTVGRYNIPSIGLFVWRLKTCTLTRSPIYYLEKRPPHYFTFSVLQNDISLFTYSVPDPELTRIAGELNLPVPIRLEAFQGETIKLTNGNEITIASADYYGADKSLAIWANDWAGNDPAQPIPRRSIIPANLTDWKYEPPLNFVAVDPELGRIAFPPDQLPTKGAWVYYNYGFVAEIGGGEYTRPIIDPSAHALSLSLFRNYDFKDAKSFVLKLKQEPPDPLSKYVREQFASTSQNLLDQFDGSTEPNDELMAALADELTALIQAGPLDETLIPPEKLTDETEQLLSKLHAGELSEQEVIRLNRLLLEAAYSYEIVQSYKLYQVGPNPGLFSSVKDALDVWHAEKPRDAIVEIVDSGVYTESESIEIRFSPFQSLQIRAALYTRPAIRLLDIRFSGRDAIVIIGAQGSRFTLDGILVFGRGIYIEQEIAEVNIRHATLVPGWELEPGCEPKSPMETSLRLVNTNTRLDISHSILGTIQVQQDEVRSDPIRISIADSILDATADGEDALSAGNCELAHAILTAVRCTVIGHVHAHAIQLAENSIFTSVVIVARRQIGCMRFCYLLPKQEATEELEALYSRTPRRYNCQPDLVDKGILGMLARNEITEDQKVIELPLERLRIRPQFNGQRYCRPDYYQLADSCADEIKRGADDESEMGVYHDLFQPQREGNLRTRLDEYTPAGMDAGIFFAS